MAWGRKEYADLGFDDTTASVLEVDNVQAIIKRRAENFNVEVVWDRHTPTALTTNIPDRPGWYKIKIPSIRSPVSKEDLIRTYMYVVHECGHLMRPKVWDICIAAQPPEALQSLFNIVEDDSMERDVANRHLGDARTLGEGNAIMCKDGEIYWKQAVQDAKAEGYTFTEESLKPMIAMSIQIMARREWDGWSREAADSWLKVMPVEGMNLMVDLVKEGWVDKLRATKTEYDSWNVACDLYDRLYPPTSKDDEQEREEIREAGNTGEARDTSEDEGGKQRADGEGDEGDDSSSDDEGSVEGHENADDQGYVINWKDIVMSEHSSEEFSYPTGGAAGITYEGRQPNGKIGFAPDSENHVVDLTGKEDPKAVLAGDDHRGWSRRGRNPNAFLHKDHSARALANKVRRFVQSQSRTKFRTNREHGNLNSQDVSRLIMPPIDGGNWNKRVFYDYATKRHLNTAVCIMVDWSGSMAGDKQVFAAEAAMRAASMFARALRMPCMISSFTTHTSFSDIAVIKHFDKPASDKSMAERFGAWSAWSGANNDADAVMWGYRRLMERKEPRKLLFVMSDGAPAGSYEGSSHDCLLSATRHIQDSSPVELFGLGIKSDAVNMYYDNYRVVQSLEDINDALFDVLKESVSYEQR
jgi:hypothetical protein